MNNVKIVKRMLRDEWWNYNTLIYGLRDSTRNGAWNVLDHLIDLGVRMNDQYYHDAMAKGLLKVTDYYRPYNIQLFSNIINSCFRSNQIHVIKWIIKNVAYYETIYVLPKYENYYVGLMQRGRHGNVT